MFAIPSLKVIENPDWEHTGSGGIVGIIIATDVPLLICYSDILFRAKVTKALEGSDADIVVTWDSFGKLATRAAKQRT